MQDPQKLRHNANVEAAVQGNQTTGFCSLQSRDPSQFEIALRPWELLARPKSIKPFHHSLLMLRGEKYLLYREDFSSDVSVIGLSPVGMLGIGIPLAAGTDTKYWGHMHGLSSCPIMLSGPLDVAWQHEHQQMVFLIHIDALRESFADREYEQLINLSKARRLDIAPLVRRDLLKFMAFTLRCCAADKKLAGDDGYHAQVYEQLIVFLRSIVTETRDHKTLACTSARNRGFQRAIEFLREYPCANPTMAELCQVAGISERTLQYAFKDFFDMSPQMFMTRRRFHSVRRALLEVDPSSVSVSEIAIEHSFFELGHFAGKYRRHFGELPSETLRCARR